MKIWMITIIMWWADPNLAQRPDAVEIKTLHGKPLYFLSEEECGKHVDDNLDALIGFGKRTYPTADAVKQIWCLPRTKS